MTPLEYASSCAAINMLILMLLYALLASRRRNGKSDLRQSRIVLVISSFALPIVTTTSFVLLTVILSNFYQIQLDVGHRGGGVFAVLASTVLASILSLMILLPRMKRSIH